MHLVTVMAGAIQAEEVVLLLIIGVRRAGRQCAILQSSIGNSGPVVA